jgi:RND family efflux transporter MFP subunit
MTDSDKADLSTLRINRDKSESPRSGGSAWKIVVPVAIGLIVVGYLLVQGNFAAAREVETAAATLTYPSQANAVLTASGYVVAQQKAAIASKATGRLTYLGVEEGDRVIKGQVIARLESQDVEAALQRARANLDVAKADSEDAYLSLQRQNTLYATKLTSKAEVDAAYARFKRVQASIKSAEAAVSESAVAFEYTRIRAPFDGTVLTKNADVGEVVAPFGAAANARGAVVTIADMSSLDVEADVSESNITRVRVGQPSEIVLDAYPERRYQGYVHKIVPTADRAKATVLTKVKFKDRDERVLPEMSAKVTFLSKESDKSLINASPRLTVPRSSVTTRGGRDIVFLVRDMKVVETDVATGEHIGDRIEIKTGLTAGDQVVLKPDPGLVDGSKVKPKS